MTDTTSAAPRQLVTLLPISSQSCKMDIPARDFSLCQLTLAVSLRQGMGFSVAASQCLVAPPYAFAAILMYTMGWISDRFHMRGPIVVFNAVLMLIGLPITGFAKGNGARYFGIFLMTGGANGNIPAVMTYQANNIRGQWKRAFCSATLVGFGGIGGIAGSLVFRSQDNPHYRPGIYACMAYVYFSPPSYNSLPPFLSSALLAPRSSMRG